VIVPIQLSDPGDDQRRALGAAAALFQARQRDPVDDAEVADLERQVAEAETAVASHHEMVELRALSSVEWETKSAEYVNADGDGIDWAVAIPGLLAASCVDEDLRDPEFWAGVVSAESWSEGDNDAVKTALLHLNVWAPDPRLPKG